MRQLLTAVIILILAFGCSEKKQQKPEGRRLHVTTYNVHFLTGGVQKVASTIKKLNPDIIALQEVPVRGGKHYGKILAGKLSYHHVSSRGYVIFRDGSRWVLSFLSRYPITGHKEIRLGKYRRALSVMVNIKGIDTRFTTMHLSPFVWTAKGIISANRARARDRKREIKDLLSFLRKQKGPDIILGDFNSLPIMGELKPVEAAGYTDIFKTVRESDTGTFPLKPHVLAGLRKLLPPVAIPKVITLDYIFLKGPVEGKKAWSHISKSSDHYPLSGIISLYKGETKPNESK